MKRWCDQGIIPTVRTVGGHRRITLAGLDEFLSRTQRVLADPTALGLAENAVIGHAESPRETTQVPRPVGQSPEQESFVAALASGDENTCRGILSSSIEKGFGLADAAEHLIVHAMQLLGEAWDCGTLDVYQERRGCEICIRLIHGLFERLPAIDKDAPVAIGGAPETDPYQLPTQLVALALREIGIEAVSLGNNLPAKSLSQAAIDYQADLVWMSVSFVQDADAFVRDQRWLAETLGENTPFILGGQALTDSLRRRLRFTAHCDNLRQLQDLAGIILKSR